MSPLRRADPEQEDREWIRQVWEGLVQEALGGPRFHPAWGDIPAMMKSAVTTPLLLKRFEKLNRKKAYANRVKPFNFLLSAIVNAINHPPRMGKGGFHLISPYSPNPSEWLRFSYSDLHSGKGGYRIRTSGQSSRSGIRVQTFSDVLHRFRRRPESKSAGPEGNPSNSGTSGLLRRLDVHVLTVFHIGKESNLLEQQEEGVLLTDPQAVYLGQGDLEAIRSQLDRVSISELSARSGVSKRMLRSVRQGTRRPSAKTLEAITEALVQMLGGAES